MIVTGGEIHTQSTMNCYGNLTVSGGEIEALQPNGNSMALMCQGDLLITGGIITSDGMNGLYSSGGSVTIAAGEVIPATGTDEPAGGGKPHGKYCICDGITGNSLFAKIIRLLCAIFCIFMSLRDALGLAG